MTEIDVSGTIAERIYRHLKESIINSEIKSNERVLEKEIANKFSVSTTPVREAIQRLAGEGLITIVHQKVSFVRETSYKELGEIYQVINQLDLMSMSLAFNNISDQLVNDVEALTQKMEDLLKERKIREYLDTNLKIHLRICEAGKHSFLYRTLTYLFNNLSRYTALRCYLFSSKPHFFVQDLNNHKKLLKALRSRDKLSLTKFAKHHWRQLLPSFYEWAEFEQINRKPIRPY